MKVYISLDRTLDSLLQGIALTRSISETEKQATEVANNLAKIDALVGRGDEDLFITQQTKYVYIRMPYVLSLSNFGLLRSQILCSKTRYS